MHDAIKHPDHYCWISGIECRDVTKHFPFLEGNAIKYIWRAGRKPGVDRLTDLRKAAHCIEYAIEMEEDSQALGSATSPLSEGKGTDVSEARYRLCTGPYKGTAKTLENQGD